ncbi:MAG: response regulator transcription factor [Pseudomonadota bacterium]
MSITETKSAHPHALHAPAADRIATADHPRSDRRPGEIGVDNPRGAALRASFPTPSRPCSAQGGHLHHAAPFDAHGHGRPAQASGHGRVACRAQPMSGSLADHARPAGSSKPLGPPSSNGGQAETLLARLDGALDRYREQDGAAAAHTIVVIGERVLVRDCLAQCLQLAYAHHDVLAFSSLATWLERQGDHPLPSVILLFTHGRRRNAANLADEIEVLGKVAVSVPVIVVSDVEDGDRIMEALEKGVRGYIPTSMAFSVAIEAVRLVEAGGTFVPVSSLLASRRDTAANGNSMFTARQIMVVEALHRGKANKQIAYELNMRESTVKVHIRHIMKKLNARNRTEVAVMTSNLFDDHVDEQDGFEL